MKCLNLSELTKGNKKNPICVRIMRKWSYSGRYSSDGPLFIGLVIADTQGTAMYAEIPKDEVTRLGEQIRIDKVYQIEKFQVRNARPTYMPFPAQLMVQLGCYTEVTVVPDPPNGFPKYIYNITPFQAIKVTDGPPSLYTDVIGYIAKVSAVSTRTPRGEDATSVLREILIKDINDKELTVTIWGNDAQTFSLANVYDKTTPKVVVGLFLGCFAKNIFQRPQISSGSAFQYFLNPDIPEAEPFYSRFKDQPILIEQEEGQIPKQNITPTTIEHTTLEALNKTNPFDFPDEGFKCTIKITEVPQNDDWWYLSCGSCKRAAQPQAEGGYYCDKCRTTETKPRYRLTFYGSDTTDIAAFFCFDDIGRQVVQAPCTALINRQRTSPGFPKELMALVSKIFTFSVHVTDDTCRSKDLKKYRVDRIVERSDRRGSPLATNLPLSTILHLQQTPPKLPITSAATTAQETIALSPSILQGQQETPTKDPTPSQLLEKQTLQSQPISDEFHPSKSSQGSQARRRLYESPSSQTNEPDIDDEEILTPPKRHKPKKS